MVQFFHKSTACSALEQAIKPTCRCALGPTGARTDDELRGAAMMMETIESQED